MARASSVRNAPCSTAICIMRDRAERRGLRPEIAEDGIERRRVRDQVLVERRRERRELLRASRDRSTTAVRRRRVDFAGRGGSTVRACRTRRSAGSGSSTRRTATGSRCSCIPGLGDDHHLFDPHREAFARQHRLILVDNRDAGVERRGRRARTAPRRWRRTPLAVVDQVGGGRFHVLGVSMGGAIAQHVALQAPDRVASLVLVSTWGRTDAVPPRRARGLAADDRAPHAGGLPGGAGAVALQPALPGLAGARVRRAAAPPCARAAGRDRWRRSSVRSRPASATTRSPSLAILQTPTLVLAGEEDILTPPRYGRALAAMLGRAELGLLLGRRARLPARDAEAVLRSACCDSSRATRSPTASAA